MAEIISGDLQYWIVYKSSLTQANIKKARAYGQRNSKEAFWNVNLIDCNTNYFMASLLPNNTEQTALNTIESQGKGFCYRKQHFIRNGDGSIGTEAIDLRPLPDDWGYDWSTEISTP